MLTSMMLQGMIGGLQSPQQGVVKVISVPKHLVGYSLEEAEVSGHIFRQLHMH
eukprot:m.513372 g.513372  ORF g.513372 m.513372 type:complete len:53 (+) comp21904_c0_seq7:927-1085(+)